jgi:PAS domain S-box-containing protein
MIKRKPTYDDLQKRVKALERKVQKAKTVEEALKIQNVYLELFFESAPEAIVFADKEHRITRISPQFTKMFGYEPHEAIGKRVDDLVTGRDKLEEASHITEQVSRGKQVRTEGIRYRKNGTRLHVDLMATPVRAGKSRSPLTPAIGTSPNGKKSKRP